MVVQSMYVNEFEIVSKPPICLKYSDFTTIIPISVVIAIQMPPAFSRYG